MGYTTRSGRYANVEDVNLNPSSGTSITDDATSRVLELGDRAVVRLTQAVTANAATSLVTTIQGSRDGVNNWYTLGVFSTVTTPATERLTVPAERHIRASFNHTGSGAIVVTLTGEAA